MQMVTEEMFLIALYMLQNSNLLNFLHYIVM